MVKLKKRKNAAPTTEVGCRKARRKEERTAKKRKKSTSTSGISLDTKRSKLAEEPKKEKVPKKKTDMKKSKKDKKAKAKKNNDDPYAHLDESTAAALRNDDEEISALEAKLGGKKDKVRLHKEYAKLEGYGDDFGEFLDGLDDVIGRVATGDDDDMDEAEYQKKMMELEENDDFEASDEGSEIVPMKDDPINDEDDWDSDEEGFSGDERDEQDMSDDSSVDSIERTEISKSAARSNNKEPDADDTESRQEDDSQSESSEENSGSHSDSEASDSGDENEPDHDDKLTYQPKAGEDIYGNRVDEKDSENAKPARYVPPHLRKKMQEAETTETSSRLTDENDPARKANLREIQQSLNSLTNRLSDDTLTSIASSIAKLYRSHPISDVNQLYWKNIQLACVPKHSIMSGLIPVYVACVSGVHYQTSDDVHVGSYVLECVVVQFSDCLKKARTTEDELEFPGEMGGSKEAANLMLVLCYLYNFGVVHCTLIYDIVRDLIDNFTDIDIEVLLLILTHSGHSLRSDDPAALKDIVLLVQERALKAYMDEAKGSSSPPSSRVQYMISAINDLKNNKKRKQDAAVGERTANYRKVIGRIKSAAGSGARSADSCLRITLQDILNVDTKGRWWKVGASWVGNQMGGSTEGNSETNEDQEGATLSSHQKRRMQVEKEEDAILLLASEQRMNTDTRRSIFCIVMGSADCDDAFEKLVRAGMLKNKTERDTIRVLVDCCGQEKAYNPFYAHLACRLCDFQPRCKFTLQLAFWDLFKLFDTMSARKAANLAKLLAHLVGAGLCLNLQVLKVIDMAPDSMSETCTLFLTVFFTNILELFDDPMQATSLFKTAAARRKKNKRSDDPFGDEEEEVDVQENDGDGLRENISVFLLQFLKSSPKNAKKSKFRANFKAAVKACESDGLDALGLM
eukprot:scaffold104023_cov48-Attheya_sp.AAC.1